MTTAYTNLLGLALPVPGELTGTWGTTVNDSITSLIESSVAGVATVDVAGADWTLTTTGGGAANEQRMAIIRVTGSSGTTRNVIAPAKSKIYVVVNASTGPVVFKSSTSTGVTIAVGQTTMVAWNSASSSPDFVEISPSIATNLAAAGTSGYVYTSNGGSSAPTWQPAASSGGSVSTVSVTTANGFTGTVANPTTTPAITIATNVTGILKGNGTSISAATAGTDYLTSTSIVIGNGIAMNGSQTMSVGGAAFTGYDQGGGNYVMKAGVTGGQFFLWGWYNSKPAFFNDTNNYMDLGANGTFNYSWKNIYLNNSPVITSDKREKTFVSTSTGLDFINKLNPVVYKWNIGGYIKDETDKDEEGNPKLIPVPGVRHHYGLFAQDVKQAMDDSNITDFGGWISSDINDPDAKQLLRYEEFIAPLIKAVQELSARLEILENR